MFVQGVTGTISETAFPDPCPGQAVISFPRRVPVRRRRSSDNTFNNRNTFKCPSSQSFVTQLLTPRHPMRAGPRAARDAFISAPQDVSRGKWRFVYARVFLFDKAVEIQTGSARPLWTSLSALLALGRGPRARRCPFRFVRASPKHGATTIYRSSIPVKKDPSGQ
jgi:hypothetical protein